MMRFSLGKNGLAVASACFSVHKLHATAARRLPGGLARCLWSGASTAGNSACCTASESSAGPADPAHAAELEFRAASAHAEPIPLGSYCSPRDPKTSLWLRGQRRIKKAMTMA